MKKFKRSLCRTLVGISLITTALPSLASIVDEVSETLKTNIEFPTKPFKIAQEGDIYFKEDPLLLSTLDVQMGVKLMDPKEYLDKFANFEMDGLAQHFGKDDKVIVSKHAAVLKNIRPEYFTAPTLTSADYLSNTLHDMTFEILDPKKYIVKQEKDLKLKKINAMIHFASFDFKTSKGHQMDLKMAEKLVNSFPLENTPVPQNEYPSTVVSMWSGIEEVNYGSHGGRTVNFYYELNERDTLLIAYKLVTIKKEMLMWGRIWTMIQAESTRSLMHGTKTSIEKQRDYFLRLSYLGDSATCPSDRDRWHCPYPPTPLGMTEDTALPR